MLKGPNRPPAYIIAIITELTVSLCTVSRLAKKISDHGKIKAQAFNSNNNPPHNGPIPNTLFLTVFIYPKSPVDMTHSILIRPLKAAAKSIVRNKE